MDIELRPATPEDVDAAVPLIYSSGPACFDYTFSHRTRLDAIAFLRRAFRRPRGEFGYQNHIVAVLGDEVVGTGTAFSGSDARKFMLPMIASILAAYGPLEGAGVMWRGTQVEQIVQPPKGALHYIAHIGVATEWRSRGIGSRIVSHLIDCGRELGRHTAALDVSVENPRAQALYERLGFRVTKELPSEYSNETAVVPAHRRMERPLI